MTPAHVEALRAAGLSERGVAQVAVIAGLFALFNRMADALGVGRGESVRPRTAGTEPDPAAT
ncbi:MAG: hypothetical protein M9894_17945 [Planctomycetes bacterium]|nr:hypothetical protein [Planctomycetota bacterium]